MEIHPTILKIMKLADSAGVRPFDRLGRDKPLLNGKKAVEALTAENLGWVKDSQTLLFVESALYIYFDCFEEAHQIAQDHEGIYGNWLHAILHRREPDAGNSKYWYQRVNGPPSVYEGIGVKALEILGKNPVNELDSLAQKISKSKTWEPGTFVDLCDKFRKKEPSSLPYKALVEIQEIEWRGLLGFILEKG